MSLNSAGAQASAGQEKINILTAQLRECKSNVKEVREQLKIVTIQLGHRIRKLERKVFGLEHKVDLSGDGGAGGAGGSGGDTTDIDSLVHRMPASNFMY